MADPTRRIFAVPADFDPDDAGHMATLRAHVSVEHGDDWTIVEVVDGMCRIQTADATTTEPFVIDVLTDDEDDAPDISGIDF